MAERFDGKIGKTYRESTPWWPDPIRTNADSPNVVMMMFDDLVFPISAVMDPLSKRPMLIDWPPVVCVTTISTPQRCVLQPGPA
jgi:hypothetical protein